MKLKYLLVVLMLASMTTVFAQKKNTVIYDQGKRINILVGYCDLEGINQDEFGVYYRSQFDAYKPKAKTVDKLKGKLDKYDFTVVFGTWCSDSKIQLPRFFKVLSEAEYDISKVKLIGVDRGKNALVVNVSKLEVEYIPTFIVYKKGKEIGRIVETPNKSLEDDLLKIIGK